MNLKNNILNDSEKNILIDVLNGQLNDHQSTLIRNFDLNHLEQLQIIKKLLSNQLIRRDNKNAHYTLPLIGLYLIDSSQSQKIFNDIDTLCEKLREQYKSNFNEPILISKLQTETKFDLTYLAYCIETLADGLPINQSENLMETDATISVMDNLFEFKTFSEIPDRYLPQWFPDKFINKSKPRNTEANATNREGILGAAVAIIAMYRNECLHGKKIAGSKVFRQIDDYAYKFWPDTGKPPLGDETSIKLINKWLKKLQ